MEAMGWQERISGQLGVVRRWRESGQKMTLWASANGVDAKHLMGWAGSEKRWQQRLAQSREQAQPKPKGFVAAGSCAAQALPTVPADAHALGSPCVRIECAGCAVVLHWPLAHSQELASWLKSMTAS
jgi:hypothetical protein